MSSNALIEMRHIARHFGHITALDELDFSVQPGEVVALLGDNGAGKSTLINMLSGEIAASVSEEGFEYLAAPIVRVTAPDTPVPFSGPLEDFFQVQPGEIAKAAKKLLAY